MNKKTIPLPDPRTPARKEVDAQVAAGNWEGFEIADLLSEEGADQIIEHCRNLAKEIEMDQVATTGFLRNQPFRWKDKVFRIIRADYMGGQALVEVVPHDDEFVAEVKRHLEQDRFHSLNVYLGFGFICFPEDYPKYQ